MVQEGGKAATGGCTGEVVTNPVFCRLYWNRVQMLDDLMLRGAVMYLCKDGLTIVFRCMHHDMSSL